MADGLTPEIEQKPQKDRPNNGSDEQGQHRIEAKSYLFIAFWIIADCLIVFGHVHLAVWVFGGTLWIVFGLVTYHAQKGWPKWSKVLFWSHVAACILAALFLAVISHQAKPEAPPKPRIRIALLTVSPDSKRQAILNLTNDFLFPPNGGDTELKAESSSGVLIIPIKAGESNATLRFEVVNDSEFPIKGFDFQAAFLFSPEIANFPVGSGWQGGLDDPPYFNHVIKTVSTELLEEKNGIELPPITWSGLAERQFVQVLLRVYSENVDCGIMLFNITFVVDSNPEAYVCKGKWVPKFPNRKDIMQIIFPMRDTTIKPKD